MDKNGKMTLSVEQTADGSPTLYSTDFSAHYHSIHGAMQESMHVFIKSGLDHYISQTSKTELSILEYGIGTGLNAVLTHQYAETNDINILYHGLEGYPVPPDVYKDLHYFSGQEKSIFAAFHSGPWGQTTVISPSLSILKEETLFEDFMPQRQYDIIYFDAFAPSCQPHLWEEDLLGVAYDALIDGGIIVTFCAKGSFKRALKAVGFEVERIPGPPGKREMSRAIKRSISVRQQ